MDVNQIFCLLNGHEERNPEVKMDPTEELLLISIGEKNKFLRGYIRNNSFYPMSEIALLSNPEYASIVLFYTNYHQFSEDAEAIFILKYHKSSWLWFYISKYKLSDKAQIILASIPSQIGNFTYHKNRYGVCDAALKIHEQLMKRNN